MFMPIPGSMRLLVVWLAFVVLSATPMLAQHRAGEDTLPASIVDGYLAAYNSHDAAGLRGWLADTLVLGGIPAGPTDERLSSDTMIARLQRAFTKFPDLRARLLRRVAQDGYIVDRYEITIGKKTEFELFSYRID